MGKTKNFYLYFLLSVSTIVCSCSSDDVIRENVMQSESVNWCPDSLGWYRDKPEDKRFYATCCIESELLYVKSLNNGLVKVTDYTDYQIANNRHRSRYSWENGWFHCTDNRTIYTLDRGLSRLQMIMWSQIAPWLKIIPQKEWVSQI